MTVHLHILTCLYVLKVTKPSLPLFWCLMHSRLLIRLYFLLWIRSICKSFERCSLVHEPTHSRTQHIGNALKIDNYRITHSGGEWVSEFLANMNGSISSLCANADTSIILWLMMNARTWIRFVSIHCSISSAFCKYGIQ